MLRARTDSSIGDGEFNQSIRILQKDLPLFLLTFLAFSYTSKSIFLDILSCIYVTEGKGLPKFSLFASKWKNIGHPSFSVSLNASQDPILDEKRVDDYPENQSDDYRDKEDSFEKMPRAFHSRFRAIGPALAAAVSARNTPWLHGRRRRDGAHRRCHLHLTQFRFFCILDLRLRQLEPRWTLHL